MTRHCTSSRRTYQYIADNNHSRRGVVRLPVWSVYKCIQVMTLTHIARAWGLLRFFRGLPYFFNWNLVYISSPLLTGTGGRNTAVVCYRVVLQRAKRGGVVQSYSYYYYKPLFLRFLIIFPCALFLHWNPVFPLHQVEGSRAGLCRRVRVYAQCAEDRVFRLIMGLSQATNSQKNSPKKLKFLGHGP